MALEKVEIVDRIEVVENGTVEVRTKTAIIEDDKQISASFHRHVVVPGAEYSTEVAQVKAICAAVHTAGVIAAYQAALAQGV